MPQTLAQRRRAGGVLSYLSLFTSFGTLLCCALPSLLVLVGLGATVASFLLAIGVGRLLVAWTSMGLLFERTVTSRIKPAGAAPFSKVRMVAMKDGSDLKALAQSAQSAA